MIRLASDDIDFMLEVLDLSPESRRVLERVQSGGLLEDADADRLRDLCGEKLQTHGVGLDYEPTVLGQRLEQLIDKLFIG